MMMMMIIKIMVIIAMVIILLIIMNTVGNGRPIAYLNLLSNSLAGIIMKNFRPFKPKRTYYQTKRKVVVGKSEEQEIIS